MQKHLYVCVCVREYKPTKRIRMTSYFKFVNYLDSGICVNYVHKYKYIQYICLYVNANTNTYIQSHLHAKVGVKLNTCQPRSSKTKTRICMCADNTQKHKQMHRYVYAQKCVCMCDLERLSSSNCAVDCTGCVGVNCVTTPEMLVTMTNVASQETLTLQ